jgi:glutaredoxin-related protein
MSGLICGTQFCGGKLSFPNDPGVGICEVCHKVVVFNKAENDILVTKRSLRKAIKRSFEEPQSPQLYIKAR